MAGLTAALAALYARAAQTTYAEGPRQVGLSAKSWLALLEGQGNVETGGSFNPTDQGKDVNKKTGRVSFDNGLAQINTAAHPEVTKAQADDPAFATQWQAKYLATLISQQGRKAYGYDAVRNALSEYNAGTPQSSAGQAYAQRVLTAAEAYGAGGVSGPLVDFGTQGPSNKTVTGAAIYGMASGGTSTPATVHTSAQDTKAANQAGAQVAGLAGEIGTIIGDAPRIGDDILIAVVLVVLLAIGLKMLS